MNTEVKKRKDYFLSESTVKSAKELIGLKQQQSDSLGRITLENVREWIMDVKKEQTALRNKLGSIEENVQTLLEILASRHMQPTVERI